MRVIKLSVSNLLKLKAVEITPAKHLVTLAGPNMAGKSSVLNAIWFALAGASSFPSSPVRQGEEEARIRLDLGEIVVTRRIKANGQTSLVVEAQNGARFPSPQAMLSSLLSGLTFDPLAFTRMAPKAQLETLKKLVKLDVDVDALDGANARDYEKRTEANREVTRLKAQLASLVIPLIEIGDEDLDESSILREMEEAATHNRAWEKREASRAGYERSIRDQKTRIAELEKKLLLEQTALTELECAFAQIGEAAAAQQLEGAAQDRLPGIFRARPSRRALAVRVVRRVLPGGKHSSAEVVSG